MQYGKRIEKSIGKSLKMAGVRFEKTLALDVNEKIDYLVRSLGEHKVKGGLAVQVSMKPDVVKMKVSKQLALNSCRYFIYLLVKKTTDFERPSKKAGEHLKMLFTNLLPDLSKHTSLLLEIGQTITSTPI